MMSYFLVSLMVFSGLIFGIIVSFTAKDELKQGKDYFIAFQNLLVAFASGVLFYFYKLDLYFVVVAVLLIFFSLFLVNSIKKSYIIYPLLALLFYASSGIILFFVLESVLIFLCGFSTAGLLIKRKKDILPVILKHISFVVIANIIPLIFV